METALGDCCAFGFSGVVIVRPEVLRLHFVSLRMTNGCVFFELVFFCVFLGTHEGCPYRLGDIVFVGAI